MLTPGTAASPAAMFVIGSLVLACCARVDRCPEPGESLNATGFLMEAGGKGFNVALAAHRLGVPVDGVFAVGDDRAGAFLRAEFAGHGLDAALVQAVATGTGAGVGLIHDDGENRIAVYPGANAALSAEHVMARSDRLRSAGLLFAQFEAPDAPIATAFALARGAGVMTILNPSPYRPIDTPILATTDMIIVNEREAAALASDCLWTGSLEGLAALLGDRGVGALIVTRGAAGALAWWQGESIGQGPFPADPVDSIGAGDAFAGAVMAALARGETIATALRWGCAAGALVVSQLGLVQALPDRAELEAMLRQLPPNAR